MMTSSRDFMNVYEKLYTYIREYLWPYDILLVLADIEVDIYSAFINIEKLDKDFQKFKSLIREVYTEDEDVRKCVNELGKLINDTKSADQYHRLPRVAETDVNRPKQLVVDTKEDTTDESY